MPWEDLQGELTELFAALPTPERRAPLHSKKFDWGRARKRIDTEASGKADVQASAALPYAVWKTEYLTATEVSTKAKILLRGLCDRVVNTYTGKRRPYSAGDVIFALALKIILNASGRAAAASVQEASDRGLIGPPISYKCAVGYVTRRVLTQAIIELIAVTASAITPSLSDTEPFELHFTTTTWLQERHGHLNSARVVVRARANVSGLISNVHAEVLSTSQLTDERAVTAVRIQQIIKRHFGNNIRAVTTAARVNEALLRVLCYNLYVLAGRADDPINWKNFRVVVPQLYDGPHSRRDAHTPKPPRRHKRVYPMPDDTDRRTILHELHRRLGNWRHVATTLRYSKTHIVDVANGRGPVTEQMATRAIAALATLEERPTTETSESPAIPINRPTACAPRERTATQMNTTGKYLDLARRLAVAHAALEALDDSEAAPFVATVIRRFKLDTCAADNSPVHGATESNVD